MTLDPDTAEALLTAGEAQLRVLLDNIPARVALLDRQRRHCYVNQEYMQYVSRPMEEILGRTVNEMVGSRPYAGLAHLGDQALAGQPGSWEGWVPHHDTGEPHFVQRFYVPYRNAEGVVEGYFTLTRDLTDLKLSEQRLAEQVKALHASEALAAAITTAALDCVVVVDQAGIVVLFNPAAEQTFGYTSSQAIGRQVAELIVPPHLRAAHSASFGRALSSGRTRLLGSRVEIEALRADGTTFPAELAMTEVRLPDRRLFAAYLRDLTAVKRAEAEIRRQREAMHDVEKMAAFGSLLAGVAHELNNPLSIVIGHALLLEEDALDSGSPEIAARAEKIRLAAERCGQTIRTFLAMARQRGLRREPVAVDGLIRSTLDLMRESPDAGSVTMCCDIPPDLPMVRADVDQLHHVLTNLIVNAQQALHTEPPPRHIRVSASATETVLEVVVADNGPGIPAAIRSRIFDPFFTTKQQDSGTGIGLAISRGIAEAHGGTLTLDQTGRRGARFVLRLPIADTPGCCEVGGE